MGSGSGAKVNISLWNCNCNNIGLYTSVRYDPLMTVSRAPSCCYTYFLSPLTNLFHCLFFLSYVPVVFIGHYLANYQALCFAIAINDFSVMLY